MIVRNEIWGLPIAVEMTLLAVASFAVVWAYVFWRRGETRVAAVGGLAGGGVARRPRHIGLQIAEAADSRHIGVAFAQPLR